MSAEENRRKFNVQVLETFAALITSAFGLVAALSWNEAFGAADDLMGMMIYAIIVTILAVIMTILIARTLAKAKGKL
jgi:uncharacterized transporter YbjL